MLFRSITTSNYANAASLDELYREIIKSDNQGYLPIFVKNRNIPEFEIDDAKTNINNQANIDEAKTINLKNEKRQKELARQEYNKRWENIITAVKTNNITPLDVAEIQERIIANEPAAVETFAWMHARGVGVKQDLVRSFNLYLFAEQLGVLNAKDNATQVYKSMSREQKASLRN